VRRSSRTCESPPPEAGFTLLELAVVLFIIGLTLTLVAPHVGGLRGMLIKSEVRRLAGRITFLSDQAASHKLVMRLTFDLDNKRYFVSQLDPYAAMPTFVPDNQPGTAPITLSRGVMLRDVTVGNIGTLARGTISCNFYPEGYVDATVIHLGDEWGEVFTIAIDPLTGRVAIGRGEYNPTARRRAGR
jgi:prepilin-type N-terminal cleavage/methylation domain-containing protein